MEDVLQKVDDIFGKYKVKQKGSSLSRRKYHIRKDVIIKTIFRAMRKYHVSKFRDYSCNSKGSSAVSGSSDQLMTGIHQYVEEKYPQCNTEKMRAFVTSFIDLKSHTDSEPQEVKEIRELVSGMIYNFNKDCMVRTFMYAEFK